MRRLALCTLLLTVTAAIEVGVGTAVASAPPTVSFRVFAHPGLSMDSIVWTGKQFLYVQNTANMIWAAPPAGMPITQFASMPNIVEETRCILSPGTDGFAPGVIFCHSPDNKIYEISADGTTMSVFATLPAPPVADGALAFDNVGRFGHRLVAATGQSGGATPAGGIVYTIGPSGDVQQVGAYDNPGGADELMIAPADFGSVGGEALLTVDAGPSGGTLLAMDGNGQTRAVFSFPDDGPNPVAAIPKSAHTTGTPAPGLYVTDDLTRYIYFLPAAQLAPYAGDLIVGTEVKAHFLIIKPQGQGFVGIRLRHNLRGGHFSLEGAIFVG